MFSNYLYFKKKYFYLKKINNYAIKLKDVLETKQLYKNLGFLIFKGQSSTKFTYPFKKSFLVQYIIYFYFSAVNTLVHITDASGNLKFLHSAGSVSFKGKQKKIRIIVLKRFFLLLRWLKIRFLKNKPVALHFNNVGHYKKFLIRNLKKYFYIRIIKDYVSYSYNGCRGKKKVRKRIRSRRK